MSLDQCYIAAAKGLEFLLFRKYHLKQVLKVKNRLNVRGQPLMRSIGVEVIISMLLLLQLATCRNDTFPKQSCQNFWTLYLNVSSSLLLRVIKFRMQTRLFRDYLALGRKRGR